MTHLRRRARWALAVVVALAALPAIAAAAALTVTTSPADPTVITDTYALLGGVVNPGGKAATYEFQWGTTTAYGQTTPVTPAGNGAADVPVDFSLDGLKPSTTYHYRLVAEPQGGDASTQVAGADQGFTTAPALALSIVGRAAKLGKDGKARFVLAVVGPADTDAQGLVTIKAIVGRATQTIAVLPYDIATGSRKTVAVRLPAAVRKALRSRGRVRFRVLAKTSGIKQPVIKNLKAAA